MMIANTGIFALKTVPWGMAEKYWVDLMESSDNRLGKRLCDYENPDMNSVKEVIQRIGHAMFYVINTEKERIIADFVFDYFTGKAAMVHFAMHPSLSPQEALKIARLTTDEVLQRWETADGDPYLETMFGMTPVTNRVACAFVQRVGFKKAFVLPYGMKDRGEVVDALVTIKTRQKGG